MGRLLALAVALVLAAAGVWFVGLPNHHSRSTINVDGSYDVRVAVNTKYTPDTIVVDGGHPVRLLFLRQEPGSCAERLRFDGLDGAIDLPRDQEVLVELSPEGGTVLSFGCDMGMLKGRLIAM